MGRNWEKGSLGPEFFENVDIYQISEFFMKNIKNCFLLWEL